MDVKHFKADRGITTKQVVAVVREVAPKFDKTLLCKVEAPEKYGVKLVQEAEQALEDAFSSTKPVVKKDNRRKPCKLTLRLGKVKMRRLLQAAHTEGFETMQACLEYIVDCWLEERQ